MSMLVKCDKCGQELETFQVRRCSNCRTVYCEPCGTRFQGIMFCSQNCAHIFFHGDIEDEGDLDREED